jgi:uncharacterized membrane protein
MNQMENTSYEDSANSKFWYGLAGTGLLVFGLNRRSKFGALVALAGADLLVRGASGKHLPTSVKSFVEQQSGRIANALPPLGVRVRRSITIGVKPEQAYQFMRDFENLPRFMTHLKAVTVRDNLHSHWQVKGPAGVGVEWDASIVDDIPGKMISWRSEEGSDIDHTGSVRFVEAPKGQGTTVHVSLEYWPPAGALGAVIAKLFGEEPSIQLNSDLKRLKQVLETGEVCTTEGQPVGGRQAPRMLQEEAEKLGTIAESDREQQSTKKPPSARAAGV